MNMVGGPPGSFGSIMSALPTQEKAFTKWAAGTLACKRSRRESPGPVKNGITPFTGGPSAMGLLVSMTVLPARAPAQDSAAATAPVPFTAITTSSPNRAASAKVPACAFGPAAVAHA